METRTSYILVGAFLIVAAVGLIAFIIWSVKSDSATQYTTYRAYFTGSVSGLNKASDVRFRGIPIGRVVDIRIDPDNIERVRVTMEIVSTTPLKEDSVASVEAQGITGVAYIQISGGSQAAAQLERKGDQKYRVIRSKRSQLEALFADAPELIDRVMILTAEVTKLFNEDNRTAITDTLTNLRTLTTAFVANSQRITELIDNASGMAVDLRTAAGDVRALTQDARNNLNSLAKDATALIADARDTLDTVDKQVGGLGGDARTALKNIDGQITAIGGAAKKMLGGLGTTAGSIGQTSEELRGLIAENRKPIRDFSGEGLYDLSRMLVEMRSLVASLSRIAERLESDPSLFLFGGPEKGYQPQ